MHSKHKEALQSHRLLQLQLDLKWCHTKGCFCSDPGQAQYTQADDS